MNAIFKRKSIRTFKDKDVEDEKIERLVKAGMQAPTALDTQPWEFIIVKDKSNLKIISEMSPYSGFAKNAALCIITLFKLNSFRDRETFVWMQQDMSACTENILLQAVDEGLGAVWLGTYPDDERVNYLGQQFEIPNGIIPFSVIAIGYPKEDYQADDKFDKSRIHYESY